MITKTLNLDNAYQDLFDEVRKKSNETINVNNLEAFFGSITEIANLDSKFLRLPLDEPLFEIDANTRKITVPENFRVNGASVQGDHLAEVIFFRIERYFDYKDLSTCNIEINWKMGAKEGKTTRFIKFDDVMTIDDVKSNCIIFGWPINNIVTEKSGALTFAVEFNQTEGEGDNKKVIYRFNTLPTTVNIKDGLIISDNAEVYTLDLDVIRTLVNSSFGEGTAAVGDLRWLTGECHGLVLGKGQYHELQDFAEIINLPTIINNGIPTSAAIDLYAQGFIDEGTKIQYTDINNHPVGGEDSKVRLEEIPVKRPMIKTTDLNNLDTEVAYYLDENGIVPADLNNLESVEQVYFAAPLIEGLKYDVQESENPEAYRPAREDELAAWGKVNAVKLFVKLAAITVDAAGPCVIRGQGYKMDNNEQHKIGSGEVNSTSIVTIPHVTAPSGIRIEVSQPAAVEEGYSFSNNIENVVFLNNGEGLISASAIIDNDKFGALQFVWEKENGDVFTPIEDDVDFQEDNESVLEVSEAGRYRVKVVNFLNADFSSAVDSAIITASPLAGKIISAVIKGQVGNHGFTEIPENGLKYNSNVLSNSSATLKVTDSIKLEDNGALGELEFQWQKEITDDSLETHWEDIPDATGSELTITSGDGVYRPIIKNNYNGSIYTFALNGVSVDNLAT